MGEATGEGDSMIDLKRRQFLFGAATTTAALVVPERKFYLMPPTRELDFTEGYDFTRGLWWARRTVDVAGVKWYASAYVTGGSNPALDVRQKVMEMRLPAWKA